VVITSPRNNEAIGAIYQGYGNTSVTGAAIASGEIYVDGSPYVSLSPPPSVSTWNFVFALYANLAPIAPGTHTVYATITDSLSRIGTSDTITFTSFRTTFACSHDLVGGNIFCEEAQAAIANANSATATFSNGWNADDKLIAVGAVAGGLAAQDQGFLVSNINSRQTTFDITAGNCERFPGCSWPSPPFVMAIQNEAVTVSTLTPFGGGYHVAVSARGVMGNYCVDQGNYPNAASNRPFVITGSSMVVACGAATSHTTVEIANTWYNNQLSVNAITDSAGLTWMRVMGTVSGPLNDYDGFPGAYYVATVPSNFVGGQTVTVSKSGATTMLLNVLRYSGIGAIRAQSLGIGYGGPGVGDARSGSFTTNPGDLVFGFCGGAPTQPVGAGWNDRVADNSRPFIIGVDFYSDTASTQVECNMNSEGYGAFGVSFIPSSGGAIRKR
jgi:hypothetical protein